MTSYAAEVYTTAAALAESRSRARAAAEELTEEGTSVRFQRALFLCEDETCFLIFDAPSAEVAAEVGVRAQLSFTRIVEAEQMTTGLRSDVVGHYLVETQAPTPGQEELDDAVGRTLRAAAAMRREGIEVHYLNAIVVPEDETCFHVFHGPSRDAIAETCRRAALDYEQIVQAERRIQPGSAPCFL
jgi:hypothetical protein